MHIVIKEQQGDGEESVLCIERNQQHAEIISKDTEHVEYLYQMAKALGVDGVYMVVSLKAPIPSGWELTDAKVIFRGT